MTTPPPLTVRQALRATRRALSAARTRGERAEVDTDIPLAGHDEYLVIRPAPAAGGGTLVGCYRYRREVGGDGVSPWRDL